MINLSIWETYKRNGINLPYDHQTKGWSLIQNGRNIIIAAGTGAGKTETFLLPALVEERRIIITYPTKALLQDQLPRIIKHYVDTFQVTEEIAAKHISVDTGDENDRTLFRADVILTTIDKLIHRIFGYGSGRWGYIYPWRIAQSPYKPTLLVFDEAHI